MLDELSVAEVTGKPFTTALEFQRDDVVRVVIVRAACFRIDIDPVDLDVMNSALHAAFRCRGQIKISADPITQQAIITMKPVWNEPVR